MFSQLVALGTLILAHGTQAQPLRVMPLGDSITYMWANYSAASFTKATSVPVQLVGSLNSAEGHGGFTTSRILQGLPGWLQQNPPDVVLLQIGTNDIAGNAPVDKSVSNIQSILNKIEAAQSVKLCLVARVTRLQPENSTHRPETVADDFNAALATALKQPTWTKVHYVGQCPLADTEMNLKDGIHPNKAGWAHLGTWWAQQLNANMKYVQ